MSNEGQKKVERTSLAPLINRTTQIGLVFLTASVFATAAAVYYPFSHAAYQQHNLELAHRHVRQLMPVLAGDHRFGSVKLSESPRENGSLLLWGVVPGQVELSALRDVVESSRPPVKVIWSVRTADSADPLAVPPAKSSSPVDGKNAAPTDGGRMSPAM